MHRPGGHAARLHLRQGAQAPLRRTHRRLRTRILATTHDTRAALDALFAGKEPPVTTTKVFGCSVKWADKVAEYANYKEKWAAEPVTLEKADAADAQGDSREQGLRQDPLHQCLGHLVRSLHHRVR